MRSELPKVVIPLAGKPLILHVLDHLSQAGIPSSIAVVGYKKEEVIAVTSGIPGIQYAEQQEQLGTGHAVLMAAPLLKDFKGTILVACGDAPMISRDSFRALIELHELENFAATVLSAQLDNPTGYGRIIRNADDGSVLRIVEEKDANPEEKAVKEVNTGTYCFSSDYLWEGLQSIGNSNAQSEYYLTDLIKIYREKNLKVGAMKLKNSIESYGINSPDDLKFLSDILQAGNRQ